MFSHATRNDGENGLLSSNPLTTHQRRRTFSRSYKFWELLKSSCRNGIWKRDKNWIICENDKRQYSLQRTHYHVWRRWSRKCQLEIESNRFALHILLCTYTIHTNMYLVLTIWWSCLNSQALRVHRFVTIVTKKREKNRSAFLWIKVHWGGYRWLSDVTVCPQYALF